MIVETFVEPADVHPEGNLRKHLHYRVAKDEQQNSTAHAHHERALLHPVLLLIR